jgi:hypothetical protein
MRCNGTKQWHAHDSAIHANIMACHCALQRERTGAWYVVAGTSYPNCWNSTVFSYLLAVHVLVPMQALAELARLLLIWSPKPEKLPATSRSIPRQRARPQKNYCRVKRRRSTAVSGQSCSGAAALQGPASGAVTCTWVRNLNTHSVVSQQYWRQTMLAPSCWQLSRIYDGS